MFEKQIGLIQIFEKFPRIIVLVKIVEKFIF